MQSAGHRARIQRLVYGAGSLIGVAIGAECPVAVDRCPAAAPGNRASGGSGSREPAAVVQPAAAEMPRAAATEVSYTATTEMRAAAAAHRAAEMRTTAAAAHSATA